MAICLLLFFVINPIFSAICGFFAGKHLKQLWKLPFMVAGVFLAGAWCFLEMGEQAFLLYSGCYLVIGIVAMLCSSFAHN